MHDHVQEAIRPLPVSLRGWKGTTACRFFRWVNFFLCFPLFDQIGIAWLTSNVRNVSTDFRLESCVLAISCSSSYGGLLINSRRQPLNGYYLGALLFTIQRIWIVLGCCLFFRSVHTFLWFLKSNWSSDFGNAETGSGCEKRVVLRRDIFHSNFKVESEKVFEQRFAFSLVVFFVHMRHFDIDLWHWFSMFLRLYIAVLLFFTIQRIWIEWGRCLFFYDSKRSIGEVLFLINFIGVIFEAGNETREKIWSDFGAEKKVKSGAKREWFLFIPLFLRERKIDVWNNFL